MSSRRLSLLLSVLLVAGLTPAIASATDHGAAVQVIVTFDDDVAPAAAAAALVRAHGDSVQHVYAVSYVVRPSPSPKARSQR